MPRGGGARPGAGRPKGSRNRPQTSTTLPCGDGCTPLSYLLAVLRDPEVDVRRRDRAAELLLAFLHERRPTAVALPPRARARLSKQQEANAHEAELQRALDEVARRYGEH